MFSFCLFLTFAYLCEGIYLHVLILIFHFECHMILVSKVIKEFEFLHILWIYLPFKAGGGREEQKKPYSVELCLVLM